MKKILKNKKGITLVALVVTIITLLILAGISIATLTRSGLFEKAKLAEQESKNAQEKEDATLGDYENKIGEYVDSNRNTNNNFAKKPILIRKEYEQTSITCQATVNTEVDRVSLKGYGKGIAIITAATQSKVSSTRAQLTIYNENDLLLVANEYYRPSNGTGNHTSASTSIEYDEDTILIFKFWSDVTQAPILNYSITLFPE